jgi:hypothetical protein
LNKFLNWLNEQSAEVCEENSINGATAGRNRECGDKIRIGGNASTREKLFRLAIMQAAARQQNNNHIFTLVASNHM